MFCKYQATLAALGGQGDGDHYTPNVQAHTQLIGFSALLNSTADVATHTCMYIHLSNVQIRKVLTCISWRADRVP